MLGRADLKKIKALKYNHASFLFLQQISSGNFRLNVLVKRSLKSVEPVLFHRAILWPGNIISAIARKRAIAKIAVNRSNIRSESLRFKNVLLKFFNLPEIFLRNDRM